MLSKDIAVAPSAEQISFDTFSMYYSHIMDASSSQRAVIVQDNEWLSFDSNSGLFEKKLDANLVVLVSSVHSPQGNKGLYLITSFTYFFSFFKSSFANKRGIILC